MTFDQYLISKKIDASAFEKAEPALFQSWKKEFDEMHANSFTVQKLNLINPIRRKYPLKEKQGEEKQAELTAPAITPPAAGQPPAAPRVARPVIKPKIN
ncbi:MAG TPA: hypothetical protein VGD65_07270 [Chryseosolibacter sp.]